MKNATYTAKTIWISSTIAALLLLFCGAAQATPLRQLSGLTSITFYESTGTLFTHTFGNNSAQMTTRLGDPLGPTNEDFHGVADENYDVFYSNANGTLNVDGSYITIEAVYPRGLPSGGGLNIAEVYLNFAAQPSAHAISVVSDVFDGNNSLAGNLLYAVDGNLNTDTSMGSTVNYPADPTRLRITVGFAPEPSSLALLGSGVLGLGGLLRRQLRG